MSNISTAALVASADGLPGTLKVRVAGGSFFYNGVNTVIPTTVVAVTKNTTNYIVLTPSTGVISSNTSGFTSVIFPIAVVVTVNSDIKTITDARPDFLIGTSLTAAGVTSLASASGTIHVSAATGAVDISTPTLIATTATPTTTTGQVGFGTTNGVGNSTPGAVLAPAQGTGSGPATPGTIVNWLEIDIAGTKFWLPLAQ